MTGRNSTTGEAYLPAGPSALPQLGSALPHPGPELAPEESLIDLGPWLRDAPPLLLSAVLHLILFILCGLWFQQSQVDDTIALDATYAEEVGVQLNEEELVFADSDLTEVEEQVITNELLPPVDDPLATPDFADFAPNATELASDQPALQPGVAYTGREAGSKQALLDAYGGTASTESAVLAGLRWLARVQRPGGYWSLTGKYSNGGAMENREAATALALLAFQGAGHTPEVENSPFHREVLKGWNFLRDRQDDDGNFFHEGASNHMFYTHALCTIALCELYGMTGDEEYREPAQRAVNFLVDTQSPEGGWRYQAGSGSDLSVTGWVVMALTSARMAGLSVPSETLNNIENFLDSVARERGTEYGYMRLDGPKPSMSAEGLLCRQYLGWKREDDRLRIGVDKLLNNLPEWRDGKRNMYYWYYATQVCHHMEGDDWRRWNETMRQVIPENQEKSGREKGSWPPEGDEIYGDIGGRLYVTCLAIFNLEVYYRHLPIYRRGILQGGVELEPDDR